MPVYFMRAGANGAVKIGHSERPFNRMRTLQSSVPDPLSMMRVIEGDKELEKAMHARFRDVHIHGEWFHHHPDMTADLGAKDLPVTAQAKEYGQELSARSRTRPRSTTCDRLLELCMAFSRYSGLALATMSTRAVNDGKAFRRLSEGHSLTIDNCDRAMRWLSDNWSDGWEWPGGIERPQAKDAA